MRISAADGAITYLFNDQDNTLQPGFMQIGADEVTQLDDIPTVSLAAYNELGSTLHTKQSSVIELSREFPGELEYLLLKLKSMPQPWLCCRCVIDRGDSIGLLGLLYKEPANRQHSNKHISFMQALSGFAAVSIESRQLLMLQKPCWSHLSSLSPVRLTQNHLIQAGIVPGYRRSPG